uniref:Uncharacterized protein n=1 Tax=Echinococcus granulosus TaxID=6210 RepID=A0A068WS32_ECHGR|nr:hypothetical protein EgrG_001110300 [Echinococcus granulosus]
MQPTVQRIISNSISGPKAERPLGYTNGLPALLYVVKTFCLTVMTSFVFEKDSGRYLVITRFGFQPCVALIFESQNSNFTDDGH